VAKWDGTGWNELGTGAGALHANASIASLCLDDSGNLYAAGWFTDALGHKYVAKWNGTAWNEVGTGSSALNANDVIFSICSDVSGNIYAAGDFMDTAAYRYVAEYPNSSATGVTRPHFERTLEIYPNPTTSEIAIAGIKENVNYSLFDLAGRLLMGGSLNQTNNKISMREISTGAYVLLLQNDCGQRVIVKVEKR
jgi:hypothetical protein